MGYGAGGFGKMPRSLLPKPFIQNTASAPRHCVFAHHYRPMKSLPAFQRASRRRALILAGSIEALVAVVAFNATAFAASGTWSATALTADWNTTANWSAAFPNGTGDTATFSNGLSAVAFGVATVGTVTLSASVNVQNIVFTGSAGAYAIGAVGGANTVTLRGTGTGSGGGLVTFNNSISIAASGTNAEVINANLLFSAPSSTSIGYNFLNNSTTTAAKLTIAGNIDTRTATNRFTSLQLDGSNTGDNTISGVITSGAGTTSAGQGNILLNKIGTGRWILSGANLFSGAGITNVAQGINVNAGTLVAGNNQAFGTTATANNNQVNINSTGTVEIANGITLDNGVSLNLNNGGTIVGRGAATTNGRINVSTAATGVTLSTVSASDVFTVGNGTNDFTGGTAGTTVTTISGPGTVLLNQSSNYAGSFSVNAGALRLGSPTALGSATTATVAFGSGSTGKLQLFGNSATLVSLNTNATVGTPTVENGAAGTATLTLNNATANTYASVLQNGTGTLALTKGAAGTLTLSGNANTYSGATTISAGVLNVTNTSGSATGTSNVALGTATLTGAGIISGTVTATGTSIITPGTVTAGSAGSGVLTLGNVTLVSGTILNYGLVSTGNTPNSNNYLSTGALTLPGSGVVLNLYTPGTSTAFAAAGVYNLFQYTSLPGVALSGSTFTFGTSISGYNATFGTSGGFLQLTLAQAGAVATWTNGGATGNWSLAGNWSGTGTLPPQAAGDSATFGATAPGTVNLDANETVGGVTFNNASAFTISSSNSSTLTLDNVSAGVTVTVTTGTHSISNAVAFNDNVSVAAASGTQLTLASNISQVSGTRSLTKTGAGTLVLSGSNAYSGGTVAGAGVLQFNSLGALGTGTTLGLGAAATNGTLRYASGNTADVSSLTVTLNAGGGTIDTNGNNVTLANAIGNSGAGSLTKTGAGTLTLGGANTYTGTTTVNNGTLSIGSNANLGAATTGAQLIFTGTGAVLASTASFGLFNGAAGTNDRAIALTGTDGTLAPATGTTLTVSGAITGTGKLIKSDAGQVTIQNAAAGQNTFNGGTLISSGKVAFADANANAQGLGTGTVTLDGGTLQLFSNGAGSTDAGNFANNIVVDNGFTGTLITMGRGTIGGSLTGSGTFNYQTDYVRAQVTGNWSAFTGQINVTPNTNGGDFRLNNTNGFGTAKINLASGVNMSMLTNFGAGGVTLSIGELSGAAGSFLGGGPTGGRLLTWSVGGANTNAQFDGTIRDGGTTGSGIGNTAITKTGTQTWTLTGSNTYTGLTTVTGGTLQIGNNGTSGSLGTGSVTNNATLAFNRSDAITVSNAITGSGSLVQLGGGTTTLSGTNSVATLFARFGTASISGSTTAANYASIGQLSGDSGTLTVQGSGSLTVNTGAGDLNVSDLAGSTGTLNTAGTVAATNLYVGKNNDNLTSAATGTVNQSGGTVTVSGANGVILALNQNAVGTYNLDGGTLTTQKISKGGGATGTFNFNGGTLKATAASATFMTGLTTANVRNGGAIFDTNSNNITVGQALIHSTIGGDNATDGGLTKNSAGTLTLTAASTYTGATTVNGGTLAVSGSLSATTVVNINAGTLLLGANNLVNDAAAVNLGGGTLATGGFSDTLGALTLTANSTIDFGSGSASELTFTTLTLGSNSLNIWNWTATNLPAEADGGVAGDGLRDRLLFTTLGSLSTAELSQIHFFSDAGSTALGSEAGQISFGGNQELVPVPEPTTIFGALALVGLVGYRERRRLGALLRRA